MQQYNGAGKACTPNTPWLVDNVYQAFDTMAMSYTANLVQYVKDAAGSTVVIELPGRRIFDRTGAKLGSYWGREENLQYKTPEDNSNVISGVVLTDGSAAVAVYDATFDLEKIFESATKARYVLKLTSRAGLSYYGFIGGVSASSNVYTFSIYNHVDLGTQNWVKTWGTGIATPYAKVEIFEYSTSFQPAAVDTFAEELPYSEFATDYDQLKSLSDGQYRVDYRRGRFLGRKLDADDTEIFNYITLAPAGESVAKAHLDGSKTVTAAGTQVALAASSTPFKRATVQAKFANTGNIYLGGSAIDNASGRCLIPGASYEYSISGDLADIYIDADTNGEGVTFSYIQ